ncbi:MAG: hypothetical protein DMF77_06800 [Acidobacteria bacterium]|nr:MAG: hypothetical protein DMF77_06800 [Acidobacteriota bacterium]
MDLRAMTMRNRYYIETFGCQMNVNDSEKVAGLLEAEGYEKTESRDSADVVFINTCAVREAGQARAAGAGRRRGGMRRAAAGHGRPGSRAPGRRAGGHARPVQRSRSRPARAGGGGPRRGPRSPRGQLRRP